MKRIFYKEFVIYFYIIFHLFLQFLTTCLIIFIKIYASNFVFHVVASLLGAGNATGKYYRFIILVCLCYTGLLSDVIVRLERVEQENQKLQQVVNEGNATSNNSILLTVETNILHLQ